MKYNKYLFLFFILYFLLTIFSCRDAQYIQGQRLYNQYCMDCHMEDGSGVEQLYPSILNYSDNDNLPCLIRNGINTSKSIVEMVGFPKMTDVEVNNIINYVSNDLQNVKHHQLINETISALEKCK